MLEANTRAAPPESERSDGGPVLPLCGLQTHRKGIDLNQGPVGGNNDHDDPDKDYEEAENRQSMNTALRPPSLVEAAYVPRVVPMRLSGGPPRNKVIPATKIPAERLNSIFPPFSDLLRKIAARPFGAGQKRGSVPLGRRRGLMQSPGLLCPPNCRCRRLLSALGNSPPFRRGPENGRSRLARTPTHRRP